MTYYKKLYPTFILFSLSLALSSKLIASEQPERLELIEKHIFLLLDEKDQAKAQHIAGAIPLDREVPKEKFIAWLTQAVDSYSIRPSAAHVITLLARYFDISKHIVSTKDESYCLFQKVAELYTDPYAQYKKYDTIPQLIMRLTELGVPINALKYINYRRHRQPPETILDVFMRLFGLWGRSKGRAIDAPVSEEHFFQIFKALLLCGATSHRMIEERRELVRSLIKKYISRNPARENMCLMLLVGSISEIDYYAKEAGISNFSEITTSPAYHTPLYLATLNCSLNFLQHLLTRGLSATVDQPSPLNGQTPLHAAIQRNSREMVELLIQHGALPDTKPNIEATIIKGTESVAAQRINKLSPLELMEALQSDWEKNRYEPNSWVSPVLELLDPLTSVKTLFS